MIRNWQPVLRHFNGDNLPDLFYQAAVLSELPIAIWRYPKSHDKQATVDLSNTVKQADFKFEQKRSGFVIAPFYKSNSESTCFINANYFISGKTCLFHHDANGQYPEILQNKVKFEKNIDYLSQNNTENGFHKAHWFTGKSDQPFAMIEKRAYCELIRKTIRAIEQKRLRKVVLSRALEVNLNSDFYPLALFNKLCDVYSNAFVSLVSIPGIGTWIGATPELLLSLKNDELTTVALAGTRPTSPSDQSWSKNWSEKEIVEQAIVSEFIRDCFSRQKIDDYIEDKTESVRIGDLLHLQTTFMIKPVSRYGENVADEILHCLHPTPAVCGVPQKESLEFIESVETHNRGFYAGYLGPVNLQNQSNLYVNLRCLQMQQSSAILYAGGGITIDSDPEQEWHETELKLDALLNFLNTRAHSKQDSALSKAILL